MEDCKWVLEGCCKAVSRLSVAVGGVLQSCQQCWKVGSRVLVWCCKVVGRVLMGYCEVVSSVRGGSLRFRGKT